MWESVNHVGVISLRKSSLRSGSQFTVGKTSVGGGDPTRKHCCAAAPDGSGGAHVANHVPRDRGVAHEDCKGGGGGGGGGQARPGRPAGRQAEWWWSGQQGSRRGTAGACTLSIHRARPSIHRQHTSPAHIAPRRAAPRRAAPCRLSPWWPSASRSTVRIGSTASTVPSMTTPPPPSSSWILSPTAKGRPANCAKRRHACVSARGGEGETGRGATARQ